MLTDDPILEQYFLYPLFLLLTGSLMTGILIPWFTNRQKNKQNAIETSRINQELDADRARQDYEFKIKLKQELVEKFNIYWITTYSKLSNFQNEVYLHFSVGPQISSKPGYQKATINLPDDSGKYPNDVFDDKWKEILETFGKNSSEHATTFIAKLSWYSNNSELIDDFEKIRLGIGDLTIIETNIINAKNTADFITYGDEFTKKSILVRSTLKEYRHKLVNLKIDGVKV